MSAARYASRVMECRWPEAEKVMLRAKDAKAVAEYARGVIGGYWSEDAERIIITDPSACLVFAKVHVDEYRDRWLPGEQTIMAANFWGIYVNICAERGIVLAGAEPGVYRAREDEPGPPPPPKGRRWK